MQYSQLGMDNCKINGLVSNVSSLVKKENSIFDAGYSNFICLFIYLFVWYFYESCELYKEN